MSPSPPFELVRDLPDPARHDRATAREQLDSRPGRPTLHDLRVGAERYRPNHGLRLAINTALAVDAPLLLTGDPGTGKTQVAYYLEWYFDSKVFAFQVRSTSTARDLKYDFDAVAYLRYAQQPEAKTEPKTRSDFLYKQALWQAYEYRAGTPILLIDEIDKAPRDFPNDLLLELDQHRFPHPFEAHEIRPCGQHPPVVVITSNAERRLPGAFLRRCVWHRIVLDDDLIDEAVRARVGEFPNLDARIREIAISHFKAIRRIEGLIKPPSTAELLTWLAVLSARGERLEVDLSPAELPCLGVLIKDADDLDKLNN